MCQEKVEEDSPALKIVDTSRGRLEDYIKKNKDNLITETTNNKRINRTTIEEKQLHGHFQ